MHKTFTASYLRSQLRRGCVQLVLLWLAGSLLGVIVAASLDGFNSSLMRLVNTNEVSIIRQLAGALLPFLFAAYAVSIGRPKLLLVLCFCKCFLFCFCGLLIHNSYGSAGWLMRALLQFSPICTMPLLCWFCLRHVTGSAASAKRDLVICTIFAAVVTAADYFVVSPLLAELIDYSMERYAYSCWI